jgi:hypothetical protein
MTNTCVICTRPTPDGYADVACAVDRPRQLLAEIQDMLPAALDVAHRQARHGTGGGASGKPGSALPLNLGATARLDGVRAALTTWARHVAEERGVTAPTGPQDPIHVAARWMAAHCEWMRHRAEVDEWIRDVEACARIVRGIARGPADRVYLGPCGAEVVDTDPPDDVFADCLNPGRCVASWDCHAGRCKPVPPPTCDGDVYGLPDGDTGRCRECGAEFDQGERLDWRGKQVAEKLAGQPIPARDIAYALRLNVKTIRSWATERRTDSGIMLRPSKLSTYWWDGERFVPWVERPDGMSEQAWKRETERRGPRLHYVADVRELAAQAAEQRAARTTNEQPQLTG